jgi:hypothetical protein
MAHRSHIIATAAEVVLDKRIRGDEAKCAAAAERVGGTAADRAAAEFWCGALIGVSEQVDEARERGLVELDGVAMLRAILAVNRMAGVGG